MRPLLFGLALVAVGIVAMGMLLRPASPEPLPPIVARIQPEPNTLALDVRREDDADKPGTLRSVMGQRIQYQEPRTSGPSPDRLAFVFDAPARVVGVVVSVDIGSTLTLAEWAIGIDVPVPYGLVEEGTHEHREFVARDWLLHVSDASSGPSKIDEQAWFGEGFAVEAGDAVTVDAWLLNASEERTGVSPEVIIYYEWAP